MLVQNFVVDLSNGCFGVEDRGKVERDSNVDVSGSGCITAGVFEKEFGFGKVEVLCIHEFQVRVQNNQPRAHFGEAVEDDHECRDTTGNFSATF